ncbi:hypothetical protein L3X38_037280 [Prunus dulcis]|uniref:Uncharacterized protein n=1 Tax=Prunus dulcis TaxID=3755 RepID=A0AAD4YR51_PRUDU|nr:hypothetical protein L3X38_037280 [Prunus dulcis]
MDVEGSQRKLARSIDRLPWKPTSHVGQVRCAVHSAHMQHKQHSVQAACRQHTGSTQVERRQHAGRSCRQLAGSYMGSCEEKFQQMCSDIKGMSGRLRMVMAEWHAWDASCGEGNVSGRSGRLPCTFVGIQHGMMACHGLDIDTCRQEQKGSLENRSSLVP